MGGRSYEPISDEDLAALGRIADADRERFGPLKFDRWDGERERFRHYQGRRVDLLMRALPVPVDADPADALAAYLAEGRTTSARMLAAKGIVLIDPADRRGEIVWRR